MLGSILFGILVLVLLAVIVVLIVAAIRRPGYICKNVHWQSSGRSYCKTCGLSVEPYNNPKCSNGHEMSEGQEFCGQCGAKIAVRNEQSPAQEEEIPAPATEKPQKKHRVRNLILGWVLAFVFFGGFAWGATYFLQIIPLKEKLKYSDKWQKNYKERLETEENRRRSLEHVSFSRKDAEKIVKERAVWKIIKWHINEKGSEGIIWIEKVGKSSKFRFEREKKIPVGPRGIENWSSALRWSGNVMLDFDHGEWGETGDYLKPKLLRQK